MPQTAATIEKAMSLFGPNYPRDRSKREETLETICDTGEEDDLGPLGDLDEIFFSLIDTENGGFEFSADEYAKTNG